MQGLYAGGVQKGRYVNRGDQESPSTQISIHKEYRL